MNNTRRDGCLLTTIDVPALSPDPSISQSLQAIIAQAVYGQSAVSELLSRYLANNTVSGVKDPDRTSTTSFITNALETLQPISEDT